MEEKISMSIEEAFNIAFPSDFGTCDGTIFSLPTFPPEYKRIDFTYGASKFVIFLNDDVVAKIPFDGEIYYLEDTDDYSLEPFSIDDYCELELEVYKDAVKCGIDVFFAKIEKVGFSKIGHRPIYIAERVTTRSCDDNDTHIHPSKDSIKRAKKAVNNCYLPEDWLAEAYEYYGVELTDKLIDFLKEKDIRDLHDDNIGYRKDKSPVILDYSDFLDDY